MGTPLFAVAWWAPLAIVGGAAAGIAISYLMLVFLGSPQPSARARRLRFEPTDRTNYVQPNVAAYVVVFGVVALIVGLAIGLSVD